MFVIPLLFGVPSSFLWYFLLALPMAWVVFCVMGFLEAFVMVTVDARSKGGQPTLVSSLGVLVRRSPRVLLWIFLQALGISLVVALNRYIGRYAPAAGANVDATFVMPHILLDKLPIREAMRYSGRIFDPGLRMVTLGTWPGLISIFTLFVGTPITLIGVLELEPYIPFMPNWIQNLLVLSPVIAFIVLSMYAMVVHYTFKWAVYEHIVHGRQHPWYPSELIQKPFQ